MVFGIDLISFPCQLMCLTLEGPLQAVRRRQVHDQAQDVVACPFTGGLELLRLRMFEMGER